MLKSPVPFKNNCAHSNNDILDKEDAGVLNKEEQKSFQENEWEAISKCKHLFRAYNKDWRYKPIQRDMDNTPIGRGSFSFDYFQAKLWAEQGHKDRVCTADLTFADHQNHIAGNNVSVQTCDPDEDRVSDWHPRTGEKFSQEI